MNIQQPLLAAAFTLSALVSPSHGQTYTPLPDTVEYYDLFVLAGSGGPELEYKEGNFNGVMGLGQGTDNTIENDVIFGGEVRRHSNLASYNFDATTLPGANTTHALGLYDANLNLVNSQINAYISNLNSLPATAPSFGNWNSTFSYTSTGAVNVLDFNSLTMLENDGVTGFTLNGSASGDDVFVIRIAGDTLFEGSKGKKDAPGTGVPVILNNLDRRNVIWLSAEGTLFDLHRNGQQNFEGVIINPTVGDNKDTGTIIGAVDFRGQVYAGSMKLGTGVVFEGSSITDPIPEPTSGMLMLLSFGGLTFLRRRRQ